MKFSITSFLLVFLILGNSCGQRNNISSVSAMSNQTLPEGSKLATFGSGCFWCTEAIFLDVNGILTVQSGYSGGAVENPTYKQVCTGTTGHAEVIQVSYDPSVISYEELLEIFWHTHDPTTLNRQGNDVGPQYRSVIFYHDDEQRQLAEHYKNKLNEENVFGKPVVTEISPFETFYVAEDYHQNYYALNGNAPYCTFVIKPKLEKFKKVFGDKLKKGTATAAGATSNKR